MSASNLVTEEEKRQTVLIYFNKMRDKMIERVFF